MRCIIVDAQSRTDTYPTVEVNNQIADMGHEASVSNISEEQIFYLMSQGLKCQRMRARIIVNGFIDAFVKELPMEYAVEINRLIAMKWKDPLDD